MAGINHMIRNAQALDIRDAVQAGIASNVKELESLQRYQLLTGRDKFGKPIGRYKNKQYAEEKHRMNPAAGFGIMDFKYTGDFYARIFTRLGANSAVISSSDPKLEKLMKINQRVFGLNPKNLSVFSLDHVRPVSTKIIKKQLLK